MEETAKLHEKLVELVKQANALFQECSYAKAYEKYAEAECYFDPDEPSTHIDQCINGIAQCLKHLLRYSDAIDAYTRLLKRIEPRNDKLAAVSVQINIAHCLSSLGQHEKAIRECCQAFLATQDVTVSSDKRTLIAQAAITCGVSNMAHITEKKAYTAETRRLVAETTTKLTDLLSTNEIPTSNQLFQQGIRFIFEVAHFLSSLRADGEYIKLAVTILNIQNLRDVEVISTAKLLYKIAFSYFCINDPNQSKKYLLDCIEVRKPKPDPHGYQRQEIAECNHRLALCCFKMQNYEDSARYAWSALLGALPGGTLYQSILHGSLRLLLQVMVKVNV